MNPQSPSSATPEKVANIQDISNEQRLVAFPVVSNSVVPILASVSQWSVHDNACVAHDITVPNIGPAIGDNIHLKWPTTVVHYGVCIIGYNEISTLHRVVYDSDEDYCWNDVNLNSEGLE